MIAFVILHYQAIDETLKCVENIKEKCVRDFKIVIVDNCSPNNTGKTLISTFAEDQNVEVILTESNLGFAKGNNIGYAKAREYNPDFIVVMNNDVFLLQDKFPDRVKESYDNYKFDVLGPDIFSTRANIHQNPQSETNVTLEELEKKYKFLYFKNRHRVLIRLKYLITRHPTSVQKQECDYTKVQFDKPLHGACYIFSKGFISRYSKCFYDKTFMYFESYILHYIAVNAGLRFIYDPSIQVEHHEDVSTDFTYKNIAKKTIWTNECLLNSCKEFIDLMKSEKDVSELLI